VTATTPDLRSGLSTSTRDNKATRKTHRTFTETKAFYKTSEFMVWVASVIGVLVVTYSDDSGSLSNWHCWLLITVLSAAYMFSRGFAKSATREPYREDDDR
jgi:hypothetical protein